MVEVEVFMVLIALRTSIMIEAVSVWQVTDGVAAIMLR